MVFILLTGILLLVVGLILMANKRTQEQITQITERQDEAETDWARLTAESEAEAKRIEALERARIAQIKWNAKQEELNRKQEAWNEKQVEKTRKLEAKVRSLTDRMTTAEMQMNRLKSVLIVQEIDYNEMTSEHESVSRELDRIDSLPFVTKSEKEVNALRKKQSQLETKLNALEDKMFSNRMKLKKASDTYKEMKIQIEEAV